MYLFEGQYTAFVVAGSQAAKDIEVQQTEEPLELYGSTTFKGVSEHPWKPVVKMFVSYALLERVVESMLQTADSNAANPHKWWPSESVVPGLTSMFVSLWFFNVGHGIYDGIYAVYAGMLHVDVLPNAPFNPLVRTAIQANAWGLEGFPKMVADIYEAVAGGGRVLVHAWKDKFITRDTFRVHQYFVAGCGYLGQRISTANYTLPAGDHVLAPFRDRVWRNLGIMLDPRSQCKKKKFTVHAQ